MVPKLKYIYIEKMGIMIFFVRFLNDDDVFLHKSHKLITKPLNDSYAKRDRERER